MRLTSKFWVDALIRRAFAEGANACVVTRGAEEAGAIFVVVNHLDSRFSLFGPAPQSFQEYFGETSRLFSELINAQAETDVLARLESEKNFDYDLWIVEIEDRQGRSFLEVSKE